MPAVRIGLLAVLAANVPPADGAQPSQQTSWTLATEDTQLSVEAAETAPRLTTLLQRGGLSWQNRASETPPGHIESGGRALPLSWHWDPGSSRITPDRIELVYTNAVPPMRFIWSWRTRAAYGPLEHTVSIENASSEELTLPLQPSLEYDWSIDPQTSLQRFWVEKGADTPSAQGTHLDPLPEGAAWEGTSSTYARPIAGQPREMIPYVLVGEPAGQQRGWFTGIEFSGRTHITLQRQGTALRGEAGLNPAPQPYRTVLHPGERFDAPAVLLGTVSGGPDGAANLLHRWIREVLNNPRTIRDPHYPYMVSNSWGSGMAVDETLARSMIRDAGALGLEMYHLDAGWFREVGDWRPDPRKFPHGIPAVVEFAHANGLTFGLWIDWTQAATSREPGALNVNDPKVRPWLIAPPPAGWQHSEPFKGITIDLGIPAAAEWAHAELERIVTDYHLDMLEHDGYLVAQGSVRGSAATNGAQVAPHVYQDSGYLWAEGPGMTDVSYHATRAYYRIYEELRRKHPQLLLEVCNDGGRMVDLGSAAHGDYFSVTDTYDPLSNRRAFYDASYVLPPAMLESYVEKWPLHNMANFRYMLRSGMLGWFSLMLDPSRWSAAQRAEARTQFALYKAALRPLIRAAELYHVSERPDGVHWDGMEYISPRDGRGVLYAFRGSAPEERTHRFKLRGLEPEAHYSLKFQDGSAASGPIRTGASLMQDGLQLTLPQPYSSELILLTRVGAH